MSERVVHAELFAAVGRRVIAVMGLGLLGMICAKLGIDAITTSPFSGLFFVGLAGAAGYSAWKLWEATSGGLLVTEKGLEDSKGRVLARMDQIARVENGLLAMKPTNGFLLPLHPSAERGWAPGLWWCTGRIMGGGGVTNAGAAKAMAEVRRELIRR